MSFDFPFVRLFGNFVITLIHYKTSHVTHLVTSNKSFVIINKNIVNLSRCWLSCLNPVLFLIPRDLHLQSLDLERGVPDEGYSRNASCTLN